jgi:hypothetical protein
VGTIDGITPSLPATAGKWIWAAEPTIATSGLIDSGTWYFRKSFEIAELPQQVCLDIGCDDHFKVWLNGEFVGTSHSPYYTLRMQNFDVSSKLKKGLNILSVEAVNESDSVVKGLNTPSAFNLQLIDPVSKKVFAASDATWKSSKKLDPNWLSADYDDSAWSPSIHVWSGTTFPWSYSVMESSLESKAKGLANPYWLFAEGNLRDYYWREGAPLFNSPRGAITPSTLSIDASDDVRFLRYSRTNPLFNLHLSSDGKAVGYPQD